MNLKTEIGQIFLTHAKDQNYTTAYCESFTKNGQAVALFVVLEIPHNQDSVVKARRAEYDKLAQNLVLAFKKTYITANALDQDSFERALSVVNLSLSRAAGKGKVGWYGRLNVAIAAVMGNQLFTSITGNALCYLYRRGEFTLLSDGLADDQIRPTKIFSNYSQGRLGSADRVMLCTGQMLNYLSLERIEEFLQDPLKETCSEIISALGDVKNAGFVAFILETTSDANKENNEKASPLTILETTGPDQTPVFKSAPNANRLRSALKTVSMLSVVVLQALGEILAKTANFLRKIIEKRSKKYLYITVGIIILILAADIGYMYLKKGRQKLNVEQTTAISQVESKLNEAESALIYDQGKATALTNDAQQLLAHISANQTDEAALKAATDRITALRNKLNTEVRQDNPTALTQFPNIPTDLMRSPNGFLGFNANTGSIAFYDFRTGASKAILKNRNTSNFTAGDFLYTLNSYVFYEKTGKLVKLNLTDETTSPLTPDPLIQNAADVRIPAVKSYGGGGSERLYLLDASAGQILKTKIDSSGMATVSNWLTNSDTTLQSARDIAIDGSLYVLYPDRVDKYMTGSKQAFALSAAIPALKNAKKIITNETLSYIYILDPDNARILMFNKQGVLQKQIVSDKFHELTDAFADEKSGLIYALSGSELLQVPVQ